MKCGISAGPVSAVVMAFNLVSSTFFLLVSVTGECTDIPLWLRLSKKSVVKINGHCSMTLAVYHGRKAGNQTKQNKSTICCLWIISFL